MPSGGILLEHRDVKCAKAEVREAYWANTRAYKLTSLQAYVSPAVNFYHEVSCDQHWLQIHIHAMVEHLIVAVIRFQASYLICGWAPKVPDIVACLTSAFNKVHSRSLARGFLAALCL
jgi:hypothetical protein